jgi:EF-P beta-lysylation protein EpmB
MNDWRKILGSSPKNINELLNILELENYSKELKVDTSSTFNMLVPLPYLKRIKKGDPQDPLLKQIIPLQVENITEDGYVLDPLNEISYNKTDGVIHKYEGRVLLIVTGACAIHCRYCFRRHYPYSNSSIKLSHLDNALDYICSDTSIKEIILSGGDPLSIPDVTLDKLIQKFEKIVHLQTLRIHTRLPVVIPARITDKLLDILTNTRLKVIIVLHINHANEIDSSVSKIIELLQGAGSFIFNQSVLLKGVNDDVETLKNLSLSLFRSNVLPYYLHLLDKAKGVAHFDVEEERAKKIYNDLKNSLPGYLVPKLVREIPGEESKTYIN